MMDNTKIVLVAVVTLIIGLAGGYYYGNMVGIKSGSATGLEQGIVKGRADLLEEQKKDSEEDLKKAQEAANPFSDFSDDANPFKDIYVNPFAQ